MLDNLFVRNGAKANYSEKTIDILRLIRSQNVGPRTFVELVNYFGSPRKALENISDFSLKGGRKKAITICSKAEAEKEIQQLSKNKAYLLTFEDFNYSKLLLQTHGFPPVLTYKGDVTLLSSEKIIAMVGARNSSINSKSFASKIAKELTDEGFITASGLAKGIDTSVHEASNSRTIAVIAGGIDHIYPQENKKLFEKIISESLLLAELPIGTSPMAKHFPQRNRIISGMSLATIVMEASLKSGSLITANFAIEQNREVFSCPGFPLDPRCMGSNKLIKDGAHLLESSKDVLDNITSYSNVVNSLKEEAHLSKFKLPSTSQVEISNTDRELILSMLSSVPVSYETLNTESGLPLPIIYTICLELELAGKISRHIGNKISLIY